MQQARARAALLTLAFGLCGCYGNFDSFAQRRAKLDCKRFANCEPSTFADVYDDDMGECRDDQEDAWQDIGAAAELLDLEYDAEEGRKCLDAAYSARNDCGSEATQDIDDACEEVFR